MKLGLASIRFWSVIGLLAASAAASAQSRTMYRCTTDGRAYLSDRPCAGATATLGSVGPVREARSTVSGNALSTSRAADFLDYMSPQCADLNEGIRNGPARGLGGAALGELHNNYQRLCRDDEQRARTRLRDNQTQVSEARLRDERAQRAEQDMQKVSRDQCDEMYRIVARKRKTVPTMTSGERIDFDRFEAHWRARCPSP